MIEVQHQLPGEQEDPPLLRDLLAKVREEMPGLDVTRLRLAYYVAEKLHAGQKRDSGEAYIQHPLAVTKILIELRMDEDTLVAALLHDILEDCSEADAEQIRQLFGDDVLHLIEGVTKLGFKPSHVDNVRSRATIETRRAAESLRKMLLAMAKDVRVMVIKLADRLHNMLTLESLSPERQVRIASETLDIYAPLAARLGIWQIKWQLEDLAFKYLYPKEFFEISDLVAKSRGQREKELGEAITELKKALEDKGIKFIDISGRPKHLYSIFNKIVKHNIPFEQIYDLLALRVIVETRSTCYVVLGIVHDLWIPIPGLFFDYIAKPKSNGYQSLHTKVIGPHSEPMEVQIRTLEMHRVAEYGVAAHWTYKEEIKDVNKDVTQLATLRQQLFDWSSDNYASSDFLRSISTDLFSEQVFAFTPKGDVIDLPLDSTPIDFAFRVHSDLALMVVGAKVNGVMVPLSTRLHNGDVVELVTRSNAQPSLDWLDFVKSANARSKLRAYFRKRNKQDNYIRGREALEKELSSLGLDPKEYLSEDRLQTAVKETHDCETSIDLIARIGDGRVSVQNIVNKLRGKSQESAKGDVLHVSKTKEGKLNLISDGLESIMLRRAKCCDPIPGEEVVGYVTRGRGMIIHRKVCPNAVRFLETERERLVPLEWAPDQSVYSVLLKMIVVNRQGLLMDISGVFGETKTNISAARIKTSQNQTAEIDLTVEVRDLQQLNMIMSKLSQFMDVISILRVFGRGGSH